jgi:hypothetical protein
MAQKASSHELCHPSQTISADITHDLEEEAHLQSKSSDYETVSRSTGLSSQDTVIPRTAARASRPSSKIESRQERDDLTVKVEKCSKHEPDILTIEATTPALKRRLSRQSRDFEEEDCDDSDGHPIQDVSVDMSRVQSLDEEERKPQTWWKQSFKKRPSNESQKVREEHLTSATVNALQGITSRHQRTQERQLSREDGQEILLFCQGESSPDDIMKESRLQRFAKKIRVRILCHIICYITSRFRVMT